MANTGLFYLYEVESSPGEALGENCTGVKEVRAECMICRTAFAASEPPTLVNIPGGGAKLQCPGCGVHQAIAAARFAEFAERFPDGAAGAAPDFMPLAVDKRRSPS